jgi:hypothetical protein
MVDLDGTVEAWEDKPEGWSEAPQAGWCWGPVDDGVATFGRPAGPCLSGPAPARLRGDSREPGHDD